MDEGEELDRITEAVIGAAIDVHRVVGPGLLESAYRSCLAYELSERGLKVEHEKPLPLLYKEVRLDCGYRLDLVVGGSVVVEVKTVERLLPVHRAQLLSYLRLSGSRVGLLINFNVPQLRSGIVRVVSGFPESRRSLRTLR
jgi:GxxExxY protein